MSISLKWRCKLHMSQIRHMICVEQIHFSGDPEKPRISSKVLFYALRRIEGWPLINRQSVFEQRGGGFDLEFKVSSSRICRNHNAMIPPNRSRSGQLYTLHPRFHAPFGTATVPSVFRQLSSHSHASNPFLIKTSVPKGLGLEMRSSKDRHYILGNRWWLTEDEDHLVQYYIKYMVI